MFCDLVGSTPLSERLDAEDLAAIILAYRDASRDVIEAFGGYVAQFLGDGILAYFGYPEAHEDDAERAVRAGLEILTRLSALNRSVEADTGAPLAARVGIHTGPGVLVGNRGDDERPERMVFGDTPNLAARIQAATEPNSVQISEATFRLLRTPFVTVDNGPFQLKGVSRPIRLIRVVEPSVVRHRMDWTHERVPLVGRAEEMALLLHRWEEAAQGKARAVCLTGESGVGKSRLARQLRMALSDRTHIWLECFCGPLSAGTPFHPVIDLIKEATSITYGDSAEQQLGKLDSAVQSAGLDPDLSLPLITSLLGLPVSAPMGQSPVSEAPEVQRRRTIETLVDCIRGLTEREPLALCVEDLHWSDPSTLELLGLLLERSSDCRLLALFTLRPEFRIPWRGPAISSIPLERLSREESRQLARAVAHGAEAAPMPTSPESALDQLADRADGNPLYVVELVKTMAEAGELGGDTLDERSIPPTLRDSLTARLDRLGRARGVAQLAATLGRELPLSLLNAVSEEGKGHIREDLDVLVESAILEPRVAPGETFYRFRHALIQEAAYFSLLRRERRQLHARIATVLEERFPQRITTEPELLAFHLRRAGQGLRAADWYMRAGRRAAGQAAVHEAVTHYRQGIAALEAEGTSSFRDRAELSLQVLLGNALMVDRGFGAPETLPVWKRASTLAEKLGDIDELTSALNGEAVYYYDTGEAGLAVDTAGRILTLARQHELRIGALRGHCTMALALLFTGDVPGALHHARAALSEYRPSDFDLVTYGVGTDQGVTAHGAASLALWWLGKQDSALAEARAAVELAQNLESALSVAMGRTFLAIAHHLRREPVDALLVAEHNVEFCERLGFPFWLGLGLMLVGAQKARLNGDPAGLQDVARGLSILGETGSRGGSALGFTILVEAQRCVGNLDSALATIDGGLAVVREQGERFNDGELQRLRAEVMAERDPSALPEALRALRAVLAEARERGALTLALRSATTLVRLAGGAVAEHDLRGRLQEIYAEFTEGFETPDLQDAAALLG